MKYQLLLVLTIVIVNLVQTKTLSHSVKSGATKRRAQSDGILSKIIKVNILTIGARQEVPEVNLGYAMDLTNMSMGSANMVSSCFAPAFVAKNKKTTTSQYSSSKSVIVKAKSDDMTKISGAMEMAIDAKVATITGKASMDYDNSSKKANAKSIVRDTFAEVIDTLDLSSVTEADLGCDANVVNITHIVTRVVRGKMFDAEVTSESKTEENNTKARGELEAKLLNLPINGKGSLSFDSKKFSENYTFRAEINASGGTSVNSATNVDDFQSEVKNWLTSVKAGTGKDENNVVISYELHPIGTYKSFGNRKVVRTAKEQMMLSRAIPIYNQMRILEAAMDQLKVGVPSSMKSEFNKKFYALQDQILEVSTAISDNKITQELVEKYDDEVSVTAFMDSTYYKDLRKKIQAGKSNIKNGTYHLSFNGKYLSPNKALDINYQSMGAGKCVKRGFFGRRVAEDKKRKLEDKQSPFACNIKFVSDTATFDDKLTSIPSSQCGSGSGNFIVGTTVKDIKNVYTNNGNKVSIHMSYLVDISVTTIIMFLPVTTHVKTDCSWDINVQTDYKDSDLPFFHLTGPYSPIQKMNYNQLAIKKGSYSWKIEEVNAIKKYFSIKSEDKQGRFLCMYAYKGYNSLVIDNVPGGAKREDCQWYKVGHYLYNAMHKTCIAKSSDIELTKAPKDSIQLSGFSNNAMECASYTEERTFDRLRRRLVKKSGTS